MSQKDSERLSSSLVIVSRRVLIAGIAGISIFSFGLGYFLGYWGTPANKLVKQVEADNKIGSSEERTVLDSSGKPTMVPPPPMPNAVPKEPPLKPKPEEGNKTVLNAPEPAEKQKKPIEAAQVENDNKNLKGDAGASHEKSLTPSVSEKQGEKSTSSKLKVKQPPVEVKTKKPALTHHGRNVSAAKKAASAKKAAGVSGKSLKTYELQVGAFEDTAKAERLSEDLSAKGYKTSVKTFSPKTDKMFSRVRLGPYKNKKEAEEAQSMLRIHGVEGIIFSGSK